MGITGSWEGWVPTPTDLYLRGNNIAGWSGNRYVLQAGYIVLASNHENAYLETSSVFNWTPYNWINYQLYIASEKTVSIMTQYRQTSATTIGTSTCGGRAGEYVVSQDISRVGVSAAVRIGVGSSGYTEVQIYRIWFS